MNKDVIYIDVEDDITAIIGKLKDSKEKIVALVPPKRVGVLQSAVNLRLLDRAAKTSDKRLVLITNNQALMALAAAAKLPVAKNAQSKPEVPEITALEVDDGDDVINGDELPIGDHMRTVDQPADSETDKAAAPLMAKGGLGAAAGATALQKAKRSVKVPNFNSFRKKLFFAIAAGVLFVAFLIWAIFFAPHATVVIAAKTTDRALSGEISLSPSAETSFEAKTLRSVRQEKEEQVSVEFEPTGKKNVGEKAGGTVQFSNRSPDDRTVPAGTRLTSEDSGLMYTTDTDVTVLGATLSFGCGADHLCPGTASVGVTAEEGGKKYNADSGSLSGAPSGVSASFTGPTSGGTDRTAKVVVAADVQRAAQELAQKEDKGMRAQLEALFEDSTVIIKESYHVTKSDPQSSPQVGAEAPGKATLTTTMTYSLSGVEKSELKAYLEASAKDEISDQPDQRVYDNGLEKAQFSDVSGDKNLKATLTAVAKVGPNIKDQDIKDKVKGKRFGDIQADIEAIQGVENVDVKFFPFWVNAVPNDEKRITVEFKLNG